MGLAEDRAMLQAAAQTLGEALGMAQALGAKVDEATGQAAEAIEGYDAQELVEAVGQIAMASEEVSTAGQALAWAMNNLEAYIERMS